MELGILLVGLFDRSWEDALDTAVSYGLRQVEPCGGGHIPKMHYDPQQLVSDDASFEAFRDSLESRGLEVCALGCHGNPVHPNPERRQAARDDFAATCRLAEMLGVGRVDVISGCPPGGPNDKSPNWIINSIYPDFKNAYRWQWDECLIPYWKEAARVAEEHGVVICMEPHGGDMVYNRETFLRLRDAVGPVMGMNVDPSHLFWLGVDTLEFIRELGEAICYAHAKDVSIETAVVRREGLAPACDFDDWDSRSWLYRAIGYGHPATYWRDYVTALRRAGYDGPVAIELEEPFMTIDDALAKSVELMRSVMPSEPTPTSSWFDNYEWEATETT
jgi:sugar phosphate isomerase/epimerase